MNESDMQSFDLVLLDAAVAHSEHQVVYDDDGTVTLRHPALSKSVGAELVRVPPERQFPLIQPTFDDLNKVVSALANSPRVEGERTLREVFERESARYEEMVLSSLAEGRWEPDYGTYVYDCYKGDLYLVAPKRWHRLGHVTSNSRLVSDPAGELPWAEIRARLAGTVVGFAGASIGGNIMESWLREARPDVVKVADPDWVEISNLNRGERMSMRYLAGSRASRADLRNPFGAPRASKCSYLAYEQRLVDPYLQVHTYPDGITHDNLSRFLEGGDGEPGLDILVEEMDDLELKLKVREACRERGIDVLMMSDFGLRSHVFWNPFRTNRGATLGFRVSDDDLWQAYERARTGSRDDMFAFIGTFCGKDYAADEFLRWIEGRGEQATNSLPQSGAVTMLAGGLGGLELALHVLGHPRSEPTRTYWDFSQRRVVVGAP